MAKHRLHVREADSDRLPMVCMVCGEPATVVKTRKMSWCPRWVVILILVNLIVMVIVGLVLTKRARLRAPLCDDHQGHWFNRRLFGWTSLLAMLFVGAGVIGVSANASPQWFDEHGEMLWLGFGGAVFAWLIALAIVQQGAIRPTQITDTEVVLTGVADTFIAAFEEAELQRRRALYPEDDEDDRPLPPTRRGPVIDAIEEGPGPRRAGGPADAIEE